MAYSSTDLDSIDQAILDFGLGKRKGRVTIGNHTVEFANCTLADLQNVRAIVAASVSTTFSPRTVARNGGRG